MSEHKMIEVEYTSMSVSEFFSKELTKEETLERVAQAFDDVYAADPRVVDVRLEAEYIGYDGGEKVTVYVTRPETDSELKARLKKEEKERIAREKKEAAARKRRETLLKKAMEEQAATEAAERAMLAELKAKYGEK
jgi:hypothetical protein